MPCVDKAEVNKNLYLTKKLGKEKVRYVNVRQASGGTVRESKYNNINILCDLRGDQLLASGHIGVFGDLEEYE